MIGAWEPEGTKVNVASLYDAVEHVRGSHEPGHERRLRLVVDLAGGADLLYMALMHHDDLIRELQRFLLVVRDEQAGDAEFTMELVEPLPKVLTHPRIERAERLVEQQHLGTRGERTGERHTLALTPGELVGVALGEM